MLQVLGALVFACVGVYALTAVFVPGWRTGWRGTRVMGGLVTHLGFGLTFTAGGALLMFARDHKDPVALAIAGPPLIVGVLLVLLGNWLDFRSGQSKSSPAAYKPRPRKR